MVKFHFWPIAKTILTGVTVNFENIPPGPHLFLVFMIFPFSFTGMHEIVMAAPTPANANNVDERRMAIKSFVSYLFRQRKI